MEENLNTFKNEIILVYGVEDHQINSRTLIITLDFLISIFHDIDSILYNNEHIEFVIESFEDGSFLVKIKQIGSEAVKNITFSIIGCLIYAKVFQGPPPSPPEPPKSPIVIIAEQDSVKVKYGNEVFSVPKDKYIKIRKDEAIQGKLRETFSILENDQKIRSFSIRSSSSSPEPVVHIDRKDFSKIRQENEIIEETFYKEAEIEILDFQSKNKNSVWKIKLNGSVESALLKTDLSMKKLRISPGTILNVELKVIKENDYYTRDPLHISYEIINIY